MTDDASTGAGADTDAPNDYDALAATLDGAIEEARRKVESGRVYDAENEKVRIKWIRALAYAVNVRRQVTNDRDLAELSERVEELEKAQDAPDAGDGSGIGEVNI
jgi:predicted RecB family endonuclease